MAAAISAVGRQAMPRKRIQAAIGAVMLTVTTISDSTGQLVNGSDEPELVGKRDVHDVADRRADAHRHAHTRRSEESEVPEAREAPLARGMGCGGTHEEPPPPEGH